MNHLQSSSKYLVCVHCMTYNQASYIEDAMKGFIMQETNFPYVCIIMDDASTDGEPEIIRQYLHTNFDLENPCVARTEETDDFLQTFAQHKINKNCYFAVFYLKYNHYQRYDRSNIRKQRNLYMREWEGIPYVSICEGDDYWTDPSKLQKQVDFLENHLDYSMCFHNAISHWDKGEKEDSLFAQLEDREYSGIEIFEKWTIPTASVLYRQQVFESALFRAAVANKRFCFGDIILFLACAAYGKVWGMSNAMSVYRRHEGSIVYGYDANRHIRQAYHSLEIYHVFGDEYKTLSIEQFFKNGMEAFLNAKAEGEIHYKLLWDLVRVAPKKTFSAFWTMLKRKVLE